MSDGFLSTTYNPPPQNFEVFNNADVINGLLSPLKLFSKDNSVSWKLGSTLAIFLHSSLFDEFSQFMGIEFDVKIDDQSYNYELKVGNTLYDMKLIYVDGNRERIVNYIKHFLLLGRCSFMLANQPNLFISEQRYHELQMFIRLNHLKPLKVETVPGLIFDASSDVNITVVTLKEQDNWWGIPLKFLEFLNDKFSAPPHNYYQTIAFPWFQPSRLKHFRTPITPKSYFIIHQYLTCLRELSYNGEPHANFLDLCNLRLAFCDNRAMNQWEADLAYEIDSLIARTLNNMKTDTNLFTNNLFNFFQYIKDKHIMWNTGISRYFQYTFQDYFNGIQMYPTEAESSLENHFVPIKFINIGDIKLVPQMTDMYFEIDCTNFAEMNIFTFLNVLKYRNTRKILLDTNHKWLDSVQPNYLVILSWILMSMEDIKSKFASRTISLFGRNTYNFVEHFLSALKKFATFPRLRLILNAALQNYSVFNEIALDQIVFYGISVDSHMLQQLMYNSGLNSTRLKFLGCSLQNQTNNWNLMRAMQNLDVVTIIEDELTWQGVFEFVANTLKESDLIEFVFTKSIVMIVNPPLAIDLLRYKFTLDSTKSKVVMVDKRSKEEVDLYYLRNKIVDDKSEYDFNY